MFSNFFFFIANRIKFWLNQISSMISYDKMLVKSFNRFWVKINWTFGDLARKKLHKHEISFAFIWTWACFEPTSTIYLNSMHFSEKLHVDKFNLGPIYSLISLLKTADQAFSPKMDFKRLKRPKFKRTKAPKWVLWQNLFAETINSNFFKNTFTRGRMNWRGWCWCWGTMRVN